MISLKFLNGSIKIITTYPLKKPEDLSGFFYSHSYTISIVDDELTEELQ